MLLHPYIGIHIYPYYCHHTLASSFTHTIATIHWLPNLPVLLPPYIGIHIFTHAIATVQWHPHLPIPLPPCIGIPIDPYYCHNTLASPFTHTIATKHWHPHLPILMTIPWHPHSPILMIPILPYIGIPIYPY